LQSEHNQTENKEQDNENDNENTSNICNLSEIKLNNNNPKFNHENLPLSLTNDIESANESLNTKCNIELLEKLHSDLDIIDKELSQFRLDDQNEDNKD